MEADAGRELFRIQQPVDEEQPAALKIPAADVAETATTLDMILAPFDSGTGRPDVDFDR